MSFRPTPHRKGTAFVPFVGIAVAWLCIIVSAHAVLGAPNFPKLSGRVVDDAGLLSEVDRRSLTEELRSLEEQTTDQLVVYTTTSLQGYPIEEYGYQLGRTWQIGQKGKDNGVILIVAPKERSVRIEVGYGLEPRLTDLICKLIIENSILPQFRRGDFPAGIMAGVNDIREVLLGNTEFKGSTQFTNGESSRGASSTPADKESMWIALSTWLFVFVYFGAVALIIWIVLSRGGGTSSGGGARSGWSGGSFGGGGFGGGGGGFSGGGGSFGGGGGSGHW